MLPVNIAVAFNMILVFGAQFSQTKKQLVKSVSEAAYRPKHFLQKIPLNISAIIFLLSILGVFKVFTLDYSEKYYNYQLTGLVVFVIFSWVQVIAMKGLGNFYSQDVVILKKHQLQTNGIYKFCRHPQYLAQFFADIGIGFALLSYLIIPLAIIETILFIMRAKFEDSVLENHFKSEFLEYKKKTKSFIPFIW